MNKVKVRFITILSLCAALVVSLAMGAWAALAGRTSAHADITAVDYAPSSVFSAGTNGSVGASEGDDSYVQFTFNDGGSTYFRRDLAYKWYSAASASDTEGDTQTSGLANPGTANYFSMKFAFASNDFELYTVSFESTEENVSKEEKAVNALLFS